MNNDFEEYGTCPDGITDLTNCTGWTRPTSGTSDYFNSCAINPVVGVPSSFSGNCPAFSGNAYVGCLFYGTTAGDFLWWEYVQGQTIAPLEEGKVYKLSMEISLAGMSDAALNEIGAYFSPSPVSVLTTQPLDVVPQCTFYNANYYTAIGSWMHVETYFVAQGGEQYLTIGNFKGLATTDLLIFNEPETAATIYMLIDNVALTEVPQPEPKPAEPETPNVFTPNSDGTNDVWKLPFTGNGTQTVSILNRWGQQVYSAPLTNFAWDGKTPSGLSCNEGAYFYRISETNISGFFELIR